MNGKSAQRGAQSTEKNGAVLKRPFLLGALRSALCALLFCPLSYASDFLSGEPPKPGVRIDQNLGRPIPLDLSFRDEQGRPVRLGDYFGEKPVILTPVYYRCPMLCNVVLEGVVNALRELRFDVGQEFQVVTVSFDPTETAGDAAAKKEKYVRRYGRDGAEDGWHFLTGSDSSVSTLMGTLGFHYQWDDQIKQWAHGTTIVVATPEGRIARYFFGIQYPPRDLRLGLVEASGGTIGSAVDQLLLLCYHYDPATGKYSGYAMNAVRIGGGASVAALFGFILLMLRREKRTRP